MVKFCWPIDTANDFTSDSINYEPITWDDAFEMIATELIKLDNPDEAISTLLVAPVTSSISMAIISTWLWYQQSPRLF